MQEKFIIAKMVKDTVPPYSTWNALIPQVILSNHPRFHVDTRFDYGFLQVALKEGYNVLILTDNA